MQLCFNYGHGGKDSGASYKGRKESDDVLNLGKAIAQEVRRHNVVVDETRTSDVFMELSDISKFENKKYYDYFISFHRNGFKPEQANGVETFTYPHSSAKAKSLAAKVQSNLVGVGFADRKLKEANFHVLRETKSAAILIELGFIDNTADNILFDTKRNEIIKGITKAILLQCGIKYVDKIVVAKEVDKNTNVNTLYRVMVGSYAERENADNHVEKLKSLGMDATVMIYEK